MAAEHYPFSPNAVDSSLPVIGKDSEKEQVEEIKKKGLGGGGGGKRKERGRGG